MSDWTNSQFMQILKNKNIRDHQTDPAHSAAGLQEGNSEEEVEMYAEGEEG